MLKYYGYTFNFINISSPPCYPVIQFDLILQEMLLFCEVYFNLSNFLLSTAFTNPCTKSIINILKNVRPDAVTWGSHYQLLSAFRKLSAVFKKAGLLNQVSCLMCHTDITQCKSHNYIMQLYIIWHGWGYVSQYKTSAGKIILFFFPKRKGERRGANSHNLYIFIPSLWRERKKQFVYSIDFYICN